MSETFGTGMEAVDRLQLLQMNLNAISDPVLKGETLVRALDEGDLEEIMAGMVAINANKVIGNPSPDPESRIAPDRLYLFERRLVFTGQVQHIGYIDNPTLSLDTLSLIVPQPDLLSVDGRDTSHFEGLEFQIPILAIKACRPLQAA